MMLRAVQVYLQSFAISRAKQHAACLEVWEDLHNFLADPTMVGALRVLPLPLPIRMSTHASTKTSSTIYT